MTKKIIKLSNQCLKSIEYKALNGVDLKRKREIIRFP